MNMRTYSLVIVIAFMLLASCGHMDVREAEIDPEGDRPPESELMSARYIEPVCDCVYIPIDPDKACPPGVKTFVEKLTSPVP